MRIRAILVSKIYWQSRRYVAELLKIREAFIYPLLHPYVISSPSTMLKYDGISQVKSPEHVPIASRFISPPAAVRSGDSEDDNDTSGMTSHASHRGGQGNLGFAPEHDPRGLLTSRRPSDSSSLPYSHRFLRPPPSNPNAVSAAPLRPRSFVKPSPTGKYRDRGRESTSTDPSALEMKRRFKESFTNVELIANDGVAPHQVPEVLWLCLEGIEGILENHLKLGNALCNWYDGQYPLVRSFADIFLANVGLFILLSF